MPSKHIIVSEGESEPSSASPPLKRSRNSSSQTNRDSARQQAVRNSVRPRNPSNRQKEIDRNEVAVLTTENEKLRRQLANSKKRLLRDDEEGNELDPESEEEMRPVTSSIERLYSVQLQTERRSGHSTPILRRAASSSQPPIRATVNAPQRVEQASSDTDEVIEVASTTGQRTTTRDAPKLEQQQSETLSKTSQAQPKSQPTSGRRRAKDFTGLTHLIALRGAKEIEARINTRDPFPDPIALTAAAIRCLENAKLHVDKKHEVAEGDVPLLIQSFKGRQSRGRQIPLNVVRAEVVIEYGFRETVKRRQFNKNLANELLQEERYAHKDTTQLIGYLENPIFSNVYKKAFFHSEEGLGLLFPRFFDNSGKGAPFPVATLALIKLQVEFCIEEWKGGILAKKPFDVKKHLLKSRYHIHIGKVEDWIHAAPSFTANIRRKWHERAMRDFATGTAPEQASRSAETIKRSLAAIKTRTGETDSEADELSDGDGIIPEEQAASREGGSMGQGADSNDLEQTVNKEN
ncbi:hypothetical protein V5O48_013509 [Marasmius crinis-equi]|uniref:DUF6532 domain-containing protein n=1 Tax=Marasmius crinis-equi TaxID=585013 RepID=A0ABR3EZW1_9AGAR